MKRISLIFLSFIFYLISFSQTLKIEGNIIDSSTGEPLPFVNIIVKNANIGTITAPDGNFSLTFKKRANDTIVISSIGYRHIEIPVQDIQSKLNLKLTPDFFNLPEVLVLPEENPAEVILRLIINNKSKNRPESLDFYSCEVYNKIRFDVNNFSERFQNRRALKPFEFIFENLDTSEIDNKIYLPVFFIESLTDFYFRRNPQAKREIIKASKMSGVKNESISQFLGNMYQETSIYDNYMQIFEKNFVSPIANNGLLFYNYYLVDSAIKNDLWCYRIEFKPRRKQELTFNGHFWVDASSYAIESFEMEIADDANINFVNYLKLKAEFMPVEPTWVKKREEILVGLYNLIETDWNIGFFANKTTSYDNYSFKFDENIEVFSNQNPVIILDNQDKNEDFWEENRHENLNNKEVAVYEMIDTLKSLPLFNTYIDIVTTITTGYYIAGLLEFGPYISLLSFNFVEGTRLGFGARTGNDFSTTIMPYGYVAYGIKDEKFKYGFGALYMLNKIPRRTIEINYKNDLEQLGKNQNSFREDYFLETVFTRAPIDRLLMTKQLQLNYEYEWFSGFMTSLNFNYKELYASDKDRFIIMPNNEIRELSGIYNFEISSEIRYAHKERFISGEFIRVSLGSKYPIASLRVAKGMSDYDYWRFNFNFSHWFPVRAMGWSKYIIDIGAIIGTAPYPLLKLHEGNQTFFFNEKSFNMMNYFEFVSDRWVSLYYTHHFDGLFFNRIPLLRKLKFREVIWGKALYGTINSENDSFNIFPENTGALSKPYFEAGVGVENILKLFRIDAGWRLSHLHHENIPRFSILMGIQIII